MKNIELDIKLINQNNFPEWKVLYKEYLEFYKTDLTEQQLITLWDWFFDPAQSMHCHIAVHENKIIGLVHFREYLRPIKAATAIFMDDLYVRNSFREMGVAQRLIKSVNDFALAKKIPLVRWATAHDNQVAMRVYDKIAKQTQWKIYDMIVTD